ncbi:MAG: thiamine pyrophosphate-binding protein, partial [Fimbriimonadaceae bacterium]|nr:thiamine pyrophosphate-binding protein [Alphaproteobacteria bacterium]
GIYMAAKSTSNMRTGGEILVDCLEKQDVRHVFCVPGESYLAVLDALYESPIEITVCRQEGGAAMMADAHGKLTGRPGICFVTRGPGATNASAGVHIAFQDSSPMILFVGQVARNMVEREAFQEIDYRRMFGPMVKWVAEIESAERIPEYVSRAFHTAMAGRPGPVVLALPEDMLRELAAAAAVAKAEAIQAHPGADDLEAFRGLLEKAEKPFIILGGGGWDRDAVGNIQEFAARWDLPVGVSFRCQDYFDNEHDHYAGDVGIGINPKLAKRVRESDLLIVLGARLGEMTTGGYELIDIPEPSQDLIHVYPGAEEIGRVYHPKLGINAGMRAMAAALNKLPAPQNISWADQRRQAREDLLAWRVAPQIPGNVQMGAIMEILRAELPKDAILCNGAGNYSTWPNRFYHYREYKTLLGPTSGSMGYGTPAAVGAKRLYPERTVIAFAGDGCFLMHGQELATAVQYGLQIMVIVINNTMYGTIRMHQEREYPGRISATELKNPDFVAYAKAFGAHGELVEKTEDFAPAFARCIAYDGPALIEIKIDPQAITPSMTLDDIRQAALAKQ